MAEAALASTTRRFDPGISYGLLPTVTGRPGWRLYPLKEPEKSVTRGKPSIRNVKEVIAEHTPVLQ